MTFSDFNLKPQLLKGLDAMGFDVPTPIQQKAICSVLEFHDILASAQTGTGKTAAYLLPVLQHILNNKTRVLDTLVLVPTRELALQIDQQVEGFGYFTGVSSIPVYGGGDGVVWEQQKKALQSQTDIVVATPGRLISHIASGIIDLGLIKHMVLDEADRMLDMGFHDDIKRIISHIPQHRQTLLFSATMPAKIKMLAKAILSNPVEIEIAIAQPAEKITQQAYKVYEGQKAKLLFHLLTRESYSSVIVFTATKNNVRKLDSFLQKKGVHSEAFHSDLNQSERERILRKFKNKELPVLVGTDVLSRGIDVEGIDLVVNFNVPSDPEDYIHRIGRTARADRAGLAITFINKADQSKSRNIERLMGREIPKVDLPKGFGKNSLHSSNARSASFFQQRNKTKPYRRS